MNVLHSYRSHGETRDWPSDAQLFTATDQGHYYDHTMRESILTHRQNLLVSQSVCIFFETS